MPLKHRAASKRSTSRSGAWPPTSALSPREREIAALITYGLTNREIATELTISRGTVAVHVHHILAKLAVRTRAQVAIWAVERKVGHAPQDGKQGRVPQSSERISRPARLLARS